jgi:cbb3-type cytochrome oxidase subunit 1
MHTLARRYIQTGIGFLVLGLLLGVYMLVRRELGGAWPHPYLVSAHTHAVFLGFVMFMILGVALWMFPRPAKDDTRYQPGIAQAVYWVLLVGTLARFAAEVVSAGGRREWLAWVILISGLLQTAALILFFWNMRSRIRPAGSRAREAQGERF